MFKAKCPAHLQFVAGLRVTSGVGLIGGQSAHLKLDDLITAVMGRHKGFGMAPSSEPA